MTVGLWHSLDAFCLHCDSSGSSGIYMPPVLGPLVWFFHYAWVVAIMFATEWACGCGFCSLMHNEVSLSPVAISLNLHPMHVFLQSPTKFNRTHSLICTYRIVALSMLCCTLNLANGDFCPFSKWNYTWFFYFFFCYLYLVLSMSPE